MCTITTIPTGEMEKLPETTTVPLKEEAPIPPVVNQPIILNNSKPMFDKGSSDLVCPSTPPLMDHVFVIPDAPKKLKRSDTITTTFFVNQSDDFLEEPKKEKKFAKTNRVQQLRNFWLKQHEIPLNAYHINIISLATSSQTNKYKVVITDENHIVVAHLNAMDRTITYDNYRVDEEPYDDLKPELPIQKVFDCLFEDFRVVCGLFLRN